MYRYNAAKSRKAVKHLKAVHITLKFSNGTGVEESRNFLLSGVLFSQLVFLLDYEFIKYALENDCANSEEVCSGAISCSLNPCINTHQANISNAILNETLVSSVNTSLENPLNYTYLMVDMPCAGEVEKAKLASLGYGFPHKHSGWVTCKQS